MEDNFKLPPLEEVLGRGESSNHKEKDTLNFRFHNYNCVKKEEADGFGKIQVSKKLNKDGHYSIVCSKYLGGRGVCSIEINGYSTDCPYDRSEVKLNPQEYKPSVGEKFMDLMEDIWT